MLTKFQGLRGRLMVFFGIIVLVTCMMLIYMGMDKGEALQEEASEAMLKWPVKLQKQLRTSKCPNVRSGIRSG